MKYERVQNHELLNGIASYADSLLSYIVQVCHTKFNFR